MKLCQKLFFDVIRPWPLVHYGWNENVVHESDQTFQMIFLDFSDHYLVLHVMSAYKTIAEVEHQSCITFDFSGNLVRKLNLVFVKPHEKS